MVARAKMDPWVWHPKQRVRARRVARLERQVRANARRAKGTFPRWYFRHSKPWLDSVAIVGAGALLGLFPLALFLQRERPEAP